MNSSKYKGSVTMARLDVAIVQSMMIVAVGVLCYYILLGLGTKQMAGLMRVLTIMVVIAVLAPAVWAFLVDVKMGIEAFVDRLEAIGDKIIFWR